MTNLDISTQVTSLNKSHSVTIHKNYLCFVHEYTQVTSEQHHILYS
ncbi:hypothetical protein E2C01_085531 [Portunus trituberculatus]|uniref:Uncharacterized protein n=1 Tax=Portunus trituberculatus TaxID=210409 RepID=A0A5B7J191_PORTR|nr:hypothetical protein [Portunus trituberculatus]